MLHESNKIDSKSVNPLKIRAYEINVWYTKKDFGKHFIDYKVQLCLYILEKKFLH